MAKTIYVLDGPNLNMLGTCEPEKYRNATLADVTKLCRSTAKRFGLDVVFRSSNTDGELINLIHESHANNAAGLIINPDGYAATSNSIKDALLSVTAPAVEIHIANIHQRESLWHKSYMSKAAKAVICGFGVEGYTLAITALAHLIGVKGKG
jgi:3-dehydroquinate dehydratase-2